MQGAHFNREMTILRFLLPYGRITCVRFIGTLSTPRTEALRVPPQILFTPQRYNKNEICKCFALRGGEYFAPKDKTAGI